jgi:hypothetical protein
MTREWAEELPEKCPPEEADTPQHSVFFRLVEKNPPSETDFYSVLMLDPNRTIHTTDKCHAMALSIFETPELCARQKKYKPFREKIVIGITLTPDSGLIQQTFFQGHYSWWRKASFDCVKHCNIHIK